MLPLFRVLAKLRRLRGGPFDIFGRTPERRIERQLIDDYRRLVDEMLAALAPANHPLIVEIARLPLEIRGFGHVKEENLGRAKAKETALLAQLRAPGLPHPMAAE